MDYFPKGDLGKYYHENRVFGEKQAWEVLRQCAEGLLSLGSAKIVHRDITPANILVRKEANKQLTFVIADLGHAIDITKPMPMSYGTQAFSAPESLAPTPSFSVKSDVFSLGLVVLFLLRKDLPYGLKWNTAPATESPSVRAASYAAIYRENGDFKASDICTKFPFYSVNLVTLLQRMLQLKVDQRITMDRVFHISSNPKHYENLVAALELDLAAEKRFVSGQTIKLAKQAVFLDGANRDRKAAVQRCDSLTSELTVAFRKQQIVEEQLSSSNSATHELQRDLSKVKGHLAESELGIVRLIRERETALFEKRSTENALKASEFVVEEREKRIQELETAFAAANKQIAEQQSYRSEYHKLKSRSLLQVCQMLIFLFFINAYLPLRYAFILC